MSPETPAELLPGTAYFRRSAQLTLRDWRGALDRRALAPNLMAGLTVTMVALPLNVALAIAAGLPPSAGLVAGAVAGVIGALFGGTRLSVTGPEVALAPITLEIAARHGLSGLAAATLLAGLIQMVFGFCRVGALVHAIPLPVIGGFLAAVGMLVFETQLPRLLGLPAELKSIADFRPSEHLSQIEPSALAVGLLVVLLMVGLPRLHKRIPAPLFGLCLAVLVVFVLRLPLPTVAPFEGVFPVPSLPAFGRLDVIALLPEALALAMLASIDSLLCAVSIDALSKGERTRTDQELVAQGLANAASACFSGMPVAAAVVRSVAAHEAGATNRLAPLTQSVALVVVLLALSSWLVYVPLVALAAILLVVGYRLIQLRQLAVMWRMARFEAVVFLATAAGILFTDFVVGVAIGVIAALAQFAHRQRATLQTKLGASERQASEQSEGPNGSEEPRLLRLEGPLFFGSQRSVEDAIHAMQSARRVIVDISAISTVDLSGATTLASALRQLAQRGVRVQVSTFGEPLDPLLRWALEGQDTGELVQFEAVDPSAARASARSRSLRIPSDRPASATIQAQQPN